MKGKTKSGKNCSAHVEASAGSKFSGVVYAGNLKTGALDKLDVSGDASLRFVCVSYKGGVPSARYSTGPKDSAAKRKSKNTNRTG